MRAQVVSWVGGSKTTALDGDVAAIVLSVP